LAEVLGLLERVEAFIGTTGNDAAHACLKVAHQIGDQDMDLTGAASALRAVSNTPSPTSGTGEAVVPDVGIMSLLTVDVRDHI
jgi:hypothetical protein